MFIRFGSIPFHFIRSLITYLIFKTLFKRGSYITRLSFLQNQDFMMFQLVD